MRASLPPSLKGEISLRKMEHLLIHPHFSSSPASELAGRGHPAYLSEGKGRRRRSSGKENKEGDKVNMSIAIMIDTHFVFKVSAIKVGKDRSHSFAPGDRKERRERKAANMEGGPRRGEGVVAGARSILLTEDNLQPLVTEVEQQLGSQLVLSSSPDIIQDLPRDPEGKEGEDVCNER